MRWSRVSYPQKIHMARMLVSGMKNYLKRLKNRGIDKAYIKELESLSHEVEENKKRQLILKGDLKMATAELEQRLKVLGEKVTEGKGFVKLELEQSLWGSFGIKGKK